MFYNFVLGFMHSYPQLQAALGLGLHTPVSLDTLKMQVLCRHNHSQFQGNYWEELAQKKKFFAFYQSKKSMFENKDHESYQTTRSLNSSAKQNASENHIVFYKMTFNPFPLVL